MCVFVVVLFVVVLFVALKATRESLNLCLSVHSRVLLLLSLIPSATCLHTALLSRTSHLACTYGKYIWQVHMK